MTVDQEAVEFLLRYVMRSGDNPAHYQAKAFLERIEALNRQEALDVAAAQEAEKRLIDEELQRERGKLSNRMAAEITVPPSISIKPLLMDDPKPLRAAQIDQALRDVKFGAPSATEKPTEEKP